MSAVRTALLAWIAGVLACVVVIAQTHFTADMSAFLPRSPTPEQKVLVDQLKDGTVSRLTLIGIEGADAATRAALSIGLAGRLRAAPEFVAVHNGAGLETAKDREVLFANRYLLSPAVTAEHFSEHGLHEAIAESIDLLGSPAGMMLKSILLRDPTGEMLRLVQTLDGGARPAESGGAWASADGARAILLAQTRASGSDIDGQQAALDAIRRDFAQAVADVGDAAKSASLLLTGSGVFAVQSRATIQREVLRLSMLSTALIVGLLLVIYRSVTALALGLLPVISGALAGVAAVSLGFGEVHGLTLGFGTTLIGEAVDYSIYLFIQSERGAGEAAQAPGADRNWVRAFWPTIRLGVLTSVCGFAALLLSGFPGLAQLGLYSISGLIVAAAVTRFVLPALLPKTFRVRDVTALGNVVAALVRRAGALRGAVVVLTAGACVVLALHRDSLWNNQLGGLSPVPAEDQARDQRLRADLGAPDARYLLAATGADADAALAAAERVAGVLEPLVAQGALGGFETPARFLPSTATQKARQAALPPRNELVPRLLQATEGLPLRAERLSPFVDDVEAARQRKLLTRADLQGTSLAQAVDALLLQQGDHWSAVLPLRAPATGEIDAARIRAALAAGGLSSAGTLLVDMKGESNRLYAGYLREGIILSLAGLAAIVALLFVSLRAPGRVLRVMAPLIASVLTVVAGLALFGRQLTILHLVGMLLIVAVGSNYALFFDRGRSATGAADTPRMLASLVCANLTTVAGFGLLAFSTVPVLQAIGLTVGPGAILALVFSAVFARWNAAAPVAINPQAAR